MRAASATSTRRDGFHRRAARRAASSGRPSIAFFGLFGVGNFGNEASLRAVREAFAEMAPAALAAGVVPAPGPLDAGSSLAAAEREPNRTELV